MKKTILIVMTLSLFSLSFGAVKAQAQTGNVGIGTTTPGSKLTVNGSFAAANTIVTANSHLAGENEFFITWNGTAAGTITLPASTSAPDRTGRLYFFKNTSNVYTLTIDANGSELIDDTPTLVLEAGESALLAKTGNNTASGTTYEVGMLAKTSVRYLYSVSSAVEQTHAAGVAVDADFSTIDFSSNGGVDFNLATDTWTCPETGYYNIEFFESGYLTVANSTSHRALSIKKNGAWAAPLQYYTMTNGTTPTMRSGGQNSSVEYLVKGDKITASMSLCIGCGPTSMRSFSRRMVISRL
ncbi:hypothetical protein [Dyadobacter sp. 676]|uniref:PA14 domain-containing protein n=1 Tax=Dyadobacter sp. 676 TaxID=3088362 RepID=A0AAU8FI30_9BACT